MWGHLTLIPPFLSLYSLFLPSSSAPPPPPPPPPPPQKSCLSWRMLGVSD
jgi:hypothetical protein